MIQAINFYRKLGYKHAKDCKTPEPEYITEIANEEIDKRYDTQHEYLKDWDYLHYLHYLTTEEGLAKDCPKYILEEMKEEEEYEWNEEEEYFENEDYVVGNCMDDGYMMILCLET